MTGPPHDRVPPHDLATEEALLGSMLLSRDAIAAALQVCSAGDFYRQSHGYIFEAISSLYGQGVQVDAITVSDELRRSDLLEVAGGPGNLIALQSDTPGTLGASRYAAIVADYAVDRHGVLELVPKLDNAFQQGMRAEVVGLAQQAIELAGRHHRSLSQDRLISGGAVLDAPQCVDSVWGDRHQSLWARGEPLLLAGPDGIGKTSLAQQLSLALCGIGEPMLLGFPVAPGERRGLYIAADRPAQALRSLRRMVTDDDRQLLDEHLALWRGPLSFDIAAQPDELLRLARRADAEFVVVDSLKDVAADLTKEETGQGLNRAFQVCCANGVDVLGLHHQRKAQAGGGKPNKLADLYGSRWITAGCGSVLMLWGEAGDPVVELTHLKQPDEPVGPLQLAHDHLRGSTTVLDRIDAYAIVSGSPNGATAADVAMKLFGNADKNACEKARRQLERLHVEGKVHREDGARGGAKGREASRYFQVVPDVFEQ